MRAADFLNRAPFIFTIINAHLAIYYETGQKT